MAYDLNNLVIVGRLTRTPSLKHTADGKPYAKFSIANNSNGKDDDVSFFEVTVWNKVAENCHQYLEKGNLVAITGRIHQNRWEGQDGKNKSRVEIIANCVSFLSSPKNRADEQDNQSSSDKEFGDYDDVDDTDITF